MRGTLELPNNVSQLYVTALDSKGALVTELRQLLYTHRVSVVSNAVDAHYALAIVDEQKDRRTAGVGGDALSSSYEITRTANYEIQLKNSIDTIKATAISVRSFNYNAASINSATQEELLLDQEMRRDLAQQMLRRLHAVISTPPSASKTQGITTSDAAPATSPTDIKPDNTTNEPQDGKTTP